MVPHQGGVNPQNEDVRHKGVPLWTNPRVHRLLPLLPVGSPHILVLLLTLSHLLRQCQASSRRRWPQALTKQRRRLVHWLRTTYLGSHQRERKFVDIVRLVGPPMTVTSVPLRFVHLASCVAMGSAHVEPFLLSPQYLLLAPFVNVVEHWALATVMVGIGVCIARTGVPLTQSYKSLL